MTANTQQTGTVAVSRRGRSLRLGWLVGWLIVGFAAASLLGGWIWMDSLASYPGAEVRAAAHLQLRFQPAFHLSQQSSSQTPDDLPQVLSWYGQHFGMSHELPQGDSCVTMTRTDAGRILKQSLTVTLCAQPGRTIILLNRTLALQ